MFGMMKPNLVFFYIESFLSVRDILFQEPVDTKGFYKKAYFGVYQEYYTDRYYLAVGKVEKEQGKVEKGFSGLRFEN